MEHHLRLWWPLLLKTCKSEQTEAPIVSACKRSNLSLKFKTFCTIESSFHGEQTGEKAILTKKNFLREKCSNSKRARKSPMAWDVSCLKSNFSSATLFIRKPFHPMQYLLRYTVHYLFSLLSPYFDEKTTKYLEKTGKNPLFRRGPPVSRHSDRPRPACFYFGKSSFDAVFHGLQFCLLGFFFGDWPKFFPRCILSKLPVSEEVPHSYSDRNALKSFWKSTFLVIVRRAFSRATTLSSWFLFRRLATIFS